MKKFLVLLAVLLLAFSFSACSEKPNVVDPATETINEVTKIYEKHNKEISEYLFIRKSRSQLLNNNELNELLNSGINTCEKAEKEFGDIAIPENLDNDKKDQLKEIRSNFEIGIHNMGQSLKNEQNLLLNNKPLPVGVDIFNSGVDSYINAINSLKSFPNKKK